MNVDAQAAYLIRQSPVASEPAIILLNPFNRRRLENWQTAESATTASEEQAAVVLGLRSLWSCWKKMHEVSLRPVTAQLPHRMFEESKTPQLLVQASQAIIKARADLRQEVEKAKFARIFNKHAPGVKVKAGSNMTNVVIGTGASSDYMTSYDAGFPVRARPSWRGDDQ